jgi:hypothetical protein
VRWFSFDEEDLMQQHYLWNLAIGVLARWRIYYAQRRTRTVVAKLSSQTRADIGWADSTIEYARHKYPPAGWWI